MLSFRPKGGISDCGNGRNVSTAPRSVTPLASLRSMTELRLLMSTYLTNAIYWQHTCDVTALLRNDVMDKIKILENLQNKRDADDWPCFVSASLLVRSSHIHTIGPLRGNVTP